jgi:serine/threonine-protein kinase
MPASADIRLEQYVLDRGLATEDELKDVRRLLNQAELDGRPITMTAALVRSAVLTPNQIRRALEALENDDAISAAAAAGLPGLQIPGVELLEKIGRGSQAIVFKGRQVSVDRIVAVKILVSRAARDPEARRRFVQEGRSAAKLSHNNIVQAIDAGEAGGYSYFVQEFIDGITVFDLMKELGGPIPEERALGIIIQIAEALAHAHSRGYMHRDVKPKNIMLTKDGVAKLSDMGLARHASDAEAALDEAGKAFGTPYYIAPEQVRGDPDIDFRADIYSLGASFYEMLAGRPPFVAGTPQQIMQKHMLSALVPPDHVNPALSAGVSEVIEVMMSKRPQDRYNSTEDLLVDLRAVAAGKPPRIAREKAGKQEALMEGLASGEDVGAAAAAGPAEAPRPRPFAVNQLVIILMAALAAAILVNILQALRWGL